MIYTRRLGRGLLVVARLFLLLCSQWCIVACFPSRMSVIMTFDVYLIFCYHYCAVVAVISLNGIFHICMV